jgi:hypothetical protein
MCLEMLTRRVLSFGRSIGQGVFQWDDGGKSKRSLLSYYLLLYHLSFVMLLTHRLSDKKVYSEPMYQNFVVVVERTHLQFC